jgi:uncharacterized protein (TIGR00369 family)
VVAKLSVEERHLQPFGVMHGGVSVTLAETVASAGAWLNCPPSRAVLVSSVSANHILPVGPGERLEAVGIPLNVGLDRQVWDVEVRCESRELVCACRCTLGPAPGGMALPERVE